MKKIKSIGIIAISSLLTLSLTGCSFLDGFINGGGNSSANIVDNSGKEGSSNAGIDFNFSIVTDNKLTFSEGQQVYMLELNQGDSYQITATFDSDKGLEVKYVLSDGTAATVNATGLVKAKENLPEGGSAVVRAVLTDNDVVVASLNIVVFVRGNNQNQPAITFNDGNMSLDNQGNYCLTRNGGQSYTFRCGYNNAPDGFSINYSLANASDSEYCSITSDGQLTTKDDFYGTKSVTIFVEMLDASGNVIASETIIVTIVNPNEPAPLGEFKVINNSTGLEVSENSEISLYVGDTLSFTLNLDGSNANGSIVVDNTYASVNGKTITAKKAGSTNIVFSAKDSLNRDYLLTAQLVISANSLVEIYSENNGNDLFILDGQLIFCNNLVAKYANGAEVEIDYNNAAFSYVIGDTVDEEYKNVTFSYTVDDVTKTATYKVLFSNPDEFAKAELGYNYKNYGLNISGVGSGYNYVNSIGDINALVIPVWFTNSESFFATNQKDQLIEDINTVLFSENNDTVYCSLKEFYAQASHDKLNISGDITEFYNSTRASTQFSDNGDGGIYPFAEEAMEWYIPNHIDKPIANYDADGNGKVDIAIFLFAGNYYGSGTNTNSYAFCATFAKNDAGVGVHPYIDSCMFVPLGVFYGYQMKSASQTGQKTIQDLSAKNAQAFLYSSSVVAHEMGHSFGCVDLYTKEGHSYIYPTGGYEPTGSTTVMNSSFEGMDPFESNVLGWTNPYVFKADDYAVGQSFDIQLNDFQTSGDNIILSPSWNAKDSPFDEYMQLELYSPNGLNAHSKKPVNDVGVRLWHINAALEKSNNGKTGYFPDDGSTSMIASNHFETDEDFDIVHLIRNNKQEEYKSSKLFSGEDLFKTGDSFILEDYQSQFKKGEMFDNRERLGWSFSVKSIFQKEDGSYSCVIRLTRVDKTIINFIAESNIANVYTTPTGDGTDYASDIFGSGEDLELIYNFNEASEPSWYEAGKALSYKGICLFSVASGNGGSLVISVKDKAGKQVSIKKVTVTYNILTNARLTGLVNGQEVTPTNFQGPMNPYSEYNDVGRIYEVNDQSFTLQNRYTGSPSYNTLIAITSIVVDYSII